MTPNSENIQAQLDHFFSDVNAEGLIEISWTQPDNRNLTNARLFKLEDSAEAAQFAAETNAVEGQNVYVSPALFHPETDPNKRTSDKDVVALTAAYADFDDEQQLERFMRLTDAPKPTWGTYTGRHPNNRVQTFWKLEEPVTEKEIADSLFLTAINTYGSDPACKNWSRPMRAAGSIAWPKKEGRVKELTDGKETGAWFYTPDILLREWGKFKPVVTTDNTNENNAVNAKPDDGLEIGHVKQDDGRERKMHDALCAALSNYLREHEQPPTVSVLTDQVWPWMLDRYDMDRPPAYKRPDCYKKAQRTIDRYNKGEISGLRNVEDAKAFDNDVKEDLERFQQQKKSKTNERLSWIIESGEDTQPPIYNANDALSRDIPPREWLWDQRIPKGTVTLLNGKGGIGKSLLTAQLAISLATGQKLFGEDVRPNTKTLAIYCEDDRDEVGRRIQDIMGTDRMTDLSNFEFWCRTGSANILASFDQNKNFIFHPFLERLVEHVEKTRPDLIILDTAAAVFGGNEIDRSQVTLFIQALLQGLCERYDTTILILAHPSKAGENDGSGTSGSTAWEGSVRSRLYFQPDSATGTVTLTNMKANYGASGSETDLHLKWENGKFRRANKAEEADRQAYEDAKKLQDIIDKAYHSGKPFSGISKRGKRPLVEDRHAIGEIGTVARLTAAYKYLDANYLIDSERPRDGADRGSRIKMTTHLQ